MAEEKRVEKAALKRIGVLSLAKVYALLFAIFGLFYGIAFATLAVTFGSLLGFLSFGSPIGLLSIVLFPIGFGIIGFVAGAVTAFLYNVVVRWTGGVRLEFEEK